MMYLKALPYLAALVVGVTIGSVATMKIQKLTKPEINLACPPAPACICPDPKPCNGIDFDKIKSRAITIQNTQYLTISGDSTMFQRFDELLTKRLEELKVVRTKK